MIGYRSDIIKVIRLAKDKKWNEVFDLIDNFEKEYSVFEALDYVDMNNHDTILHIACKQDIDVIIVKKLLKYISIDTLNKYDETVLHSACFKIYWKDDINNSFNLIKTLISEGTYSSVNINCFSYLINSQLSTPLSYVLNQKFSLQNDKTYKTTLGIIDYLISLGADVNIYPKEFKSNYGYSPFLIAKINLLRNSNEYINNIVNHLEKHGGNTSYVKDTYKGVVDSCL